MSRIIIYLGLPSPAASSDLPESRPGKPVALCLVLLRMGFTCAPSVTKRAVVSYTAFPPLPGIPRREALSANGGAVYFYCTGLGVTSTGRYPASCPLKPGLSSSAPFRLYSRDHLTCLHECYSNTNIFLSKEKNHQDFYTSKQLPPTNSLNSELCGISSLGTEMK